MATVKKTTTEETTKTLVELLAEVQAELKAPKGQRNNFGKYNYRSAEDIVEAVKPLLNSRGLVLKLTDDMRLLGDRYYVVATASVKNKSGEVESAEGWAREALSQAGMSDGQVTGATSSYARKYALNGLFAIDDTKDLDSEEYQGKPVSETDKKAPTAQPKTTKSSKQPLLKGTPEYENVLKALRGKTRTMAQVIGYYEVSPELKKELETIK